MSFAFGSRSLFLNGSTLNFGISLKSAMDCKAKPKPDDVTHKRQPMNIRLYTFEWAINNYSMLHIPTKISSPSLPLEHHSEKNLKLFLSRNGDVLKIEVHLLKELHPTEKYRVPCETSTSIAKVIPKYFLHLEFLDSNGKTIDYYKSLSSDDILTDENLIRSWTKEENVSRFICNDTLSIRVKLSMRQYPDGQEDEATKVTSTKVLMDNMKGLFNDRGKFPDLLIRVGGKIILAHKSIVYTQCPSLAKMIKSDENTAEQAAFFKLPTNIKEILLKNHDVLSIPNEDFDVFLSILHFIYSGQLCVTEAIDDFAIFECAKKYSVRELCMMMMPRKIRNCSVVRIEKLSYTWYVKNFSSLCKTGFVPIPGPEFSTKTNADVDWCMVLVCLDSKSIIVNLQRTSGFNVDIKTIFKLAICTATGAIQDEREYKHLFTKNTFTNCHPGYINSESRFTITPDLLFNDTLTVCCDLIVSTGDIDSRIEHAYPGLYSEIDCKSWVDNFQALLQNGTYSDATLIADGEEFKIHKAIVSARSPVFSRMFVSDMKEKESGCVEIKDASSAVLKQLLLYIYTGEVSCTMEHCPELYRMADKYEILDLKSRCANYIMDNIDSDNAVEILGLGDLYSDLKMKNLAKEKICQNAQRCLLSPQGVELITEHQDLAYDVLVSLSVAYCALPPQGEV